MVLHRSNAYDALHHGGVPQESHGVGTFSPKCMKVNSSARLFMMLHVPPILQTPAINLEWKSFLGQCICYHFPGRESN